MSPNRVWQPLTPSAPAEPLFEFHNLADLARRPELLRPPTALIPHIAYEGRTTLLAAREKVGKTTFVSDAVKRLTLAEPVLGQPTSRRAQILWLTEEDIGDVVRRFISTGAAGEWIDIAQLPFAGRPIDRIRELRGEIERSTPDLIVVDTLSALIAGLTSNNDSAEVANVMVPLCNIPREYRCAMIVLAHASKDGAGYRGSTEFGARVDVIVEMTQGSLAYQRKLDVKGRYGMHKLVVAYENDTFELATTTELSLDMRVRDYVMHNPQATQNAIERDVGGNREQVRRAITALVRAGRIIDEPVARGGRPAVHRFSVPAGIPRANERANQSSWDSAEQEEEGG